MNRLIGTARRRWYLVAAAALLIVVGTILLVSRLSSLQEDETWDRIQREGVMRVGMDASYPPFDLVSGNGEFEGYDVDLAREIATRLGVRVEFVNIFFDGLYDALASERVDLIISALPYDRLLTRDVAYSYSYFNAGQVLLVASGDDHIRSADDLNGKRVAVALGSGAYQAGLQVKRRDKLDLTLLPQQTPEEVIAALLQGKADAAIYDGIAARQVIRQGAHVKIVGEPLADEPYVIAVRLDSPQLLEKVNETLVQLREEGFLQHLEDKWF